MKGKRFLVGFVVTAITFCSGALANEIYKWTDDDGNVHYEDRPSGAATEQRLALSYGRTDSSAVQKRVQARIDGQVAREEARASAADAATAAEEARAEAERNKQKCEKYRAQMQTMLQSRRLYREDSDGERVYLDDEQRQEARQRVEEMIAETCS